MNGEKNQYRKGRFNDVTQIIKKIYNKCQPDN